MRVHPPALLLPTTDFLHRWQHDPHHGRLFDDDPEFAPPRTLLANKIHLYSHIHGAQVGFALRRLAARVALNTTAPLSAIDMSATLGDPARAWERLIARQGAVKRHQHRLPLARLIRCGLLLSRV